MKWFSKKKMSIFFKKVMYMVKNSAHISCDLDLNIQLIHCKFLPTRFL